MAPRAAAPPLEDPRRERLRIRPWVDTALDRAGLEPRSAYVAQFWLPLLGPSATWLVLRLQAGLERAPSGFECSAAQLAGCLGLGRTGRSRTLLRAFQRAADHGLLRGGGEGTFAVRRRWPPLGYRQVARLPESLRAAHAADAYLGCGREVPTGGMTDDPGGGAPG